MSEKIKTEDRHKLPMAILGGVALVICFGWWLMWILWILGLIIYQPLQALMIAIGAGLYWLGYQVGKGKGREEERNKQNKPTNYD